jgi:hypothetical protein
MPGWWYFGPLAGGFLLAGIFLTIGITSGGIWLVQQLRSRPACRARRWSLRALGGTLWSAAIVSAVVGTELMCLWYVAVGLVVAGVSLVRAARSNRVPDSAPEAVVPGSGAMRTCAPNKQAGAEPGAEPDLTA